MVEDGSVEGDDLIVSSGNTASLVCVAAVPNSAGSAARWAGFWSSGSAEVYSLATLNELEPASGGEVWVVATRQPRSPR